MKKVADKESIINFVQQRIDELHRRIAPMITRFVGYPLIIPDRRFNCYPVLFVDAFPSVKMEELKQLSLAFRVGWEYVSISDPVFDTKDGATPSNLICAQLFYERFLRELHRIFNVDSPFWKYYEEYLYEFSMAILTEIIRVKYGLGDYSFDEFTHCSANKISFGKMVIASLGVINDASDRIPPLAQSHDYFYIGAQLRDDLIDWYDDYMAGRHTFLIRKTLSEHGISQDDYVKRNLKPDEFMEILYLSDIAGWVIEESRRYFNMAREEVDRCGLQTAEWLNVIKEFIHSLDRLSMELEDYRLKGVSCKSG